MLDLTEHSQSSKWISRVSMMHELFLMQKLELKRKQKTLVILEAEVSVIKKRVIHVATKYTLNY